MRKRELEKIWKQLDNSLEALERLANEESVINNYNVFHEIVSIKNKVEVLIENKSRK